MSTFHRKQNGWRTQQRTTCEARQVTKRQTTTAKTRKLLPKPPLARNKAVPEPCRRHRCQLRQTTSSQQRPPGARRDGNERAKKKNKKGEKKERRSRDTSFSTNSPPSAPPPPAPSEGRRGTALTGPLETSPRLRLAASLGRIPPELSACCRRFLCCAAESRKQKKEMAGGMMRIGGSESELQI